MSGFSEITVLIILIAFVLEFFDISLGMGYGTTLSPILFMMDFPILDIASALLINNVVIGLSAVFFHLEFKNISFRKRSRDLKVTSLISAFGIIAVLISIVVAVNVPEKYLIIYIGTLVIGVGILTLFKKPQKNDTRISYRRIVGFGILASFNKGISGGGYGPVVVSGQIISGINSRTAVAIATISEGFVSVVGATVYILIKAVPINWSLTISLLIGSLIAVPLASYTISKIDSQKLRMAVGIASIVLGIATLMKLLFLEVNGG